MGRWVNYIYQHMVDYRFIKLGYLFVIAMEYMDRKTFFEIVVYTLRCIYK